MQIVALRVAELLGRGGLAAGVRGDEEGVDVHVGANLTGIASTSIAAALIARLPQKRVALEGEVELLGREARGVTGRIVVVAHG